MTVKLIYLLKDIDATMALGQCLARILRPGDAIFLSGDLGAGKTTLTKAIGSGLGIDPGEITSPSFTLVHEHPGGRIPLIHADLYRLGPGADILETGLEEYLDGDNLVIIEWAGYLGEDLVSDPLLLHLSFVDEAVRRAEITCPFQGWRTRLKALADCFERRVIPHEGISP